MFPLRADVPSTVWLLLSILGICVPAATLGWSLPDKTASAVEESSRRHWMQQVGKTALIGVSTSATTSFLAFKGPLAAVAVVASTTPSKDLKEEYRQGTAALADLEEAAPLPREAYQTLDSGVIYADVRPGPMGAPTVQEGNRVNVQWVLRRSNGYFVDSSQVQNSIPFIFTVGGEEAIVGLDQGIRGMKEGGVRRLIIPPSLAYVDGLEDGKPGPLPAGFGPRQQMRRVQLVRNNVPGEYVYLEIQVTRVR